MSEVQESPPLSCASSRREIRVVGHRPFWAGVQARGRKLRGHGMLGHFHAGCRNRKIREMDADPVSIDTAYRLALVLAVPTKYTTVGLNWGRHVAPATNDREHLKLCPISCRLAEGVSE